MNKTAVLAGPMGIFVGVIFGALIDNMAIGILVGFALAFGLVKLNLGKSQARASQTDHPVPETGDRDGEAPKS